VRMKASNFLHNPETFNRKLSIWSYSWKAGKRNIGERKIARAWDCSAGRVMRRGSSTAKKEEVEVRPTNRSRT
jgi:hypothetical protein